MAQAAAIPPPGPAVKQPGVVEFLRARYAEEEAIARAATPGPWKWGVVAPGIKADSVLQGRWVVLLTSKSGDVSHDDAVHIARWNPAHVLADLAAKRAILDIHETSHQRILSECHVAIEPPEWQGPDRSNPACMMVRALLGPFQDHPDFHPAWPADA